MRVLQGGNIIRAIDGVRSMARIVCIKALGYSITISDEAKNFIASKGCDVQFGVAF